MTVQGLDEARRLLGDRVLGPAEVGAAFGGDPLAPLDEAERATVTRIPFAPEALADAARDDAMLVLRLPRTESGPLTLVRLGTCFPNGLDPRGHRGVGYALRDEWTLDTQPFATADTCEAGWALVRRSPLAATLGKTRAGQDAVLSRLPRGARPVRRSAVEIVYDTLVWHAARGERLLASCWDWSRSESSDGGYAAVGEFGAAGLRVVAYSAAVRFGTLGVCVQQ